MKVLKKIFMYIALFILLIILFVSGVILIDSIINPNEVPSFFGWKPFIALSDSMVPTILPGDLVIVHEEDNREFKVNDIVAYNNNNLYITHRIVDIVKKNDEIRYITKGDNNSREDNGYVTIDNIEGIYLYRIAKLGDVAMFIQTPLGIMICLALPMGLILFQKSSIDRNEKKELEERINELEKNKK